MDYKIKFKRFIFDNRIVLFCYALYIFLMYESRNNLNVSIDSSFFENDPTMTYNWLNIGRYGMAFTKKIFMPTGYNAYYEGILTCLAMILMGILFLYYFNNVLNANLPKTICLLLICSSSSGVAFAFQYFFKMQIFEIYFGVDLAIAAAISIYIYIYKKKREYFFLSIILMVYSFSIYQAMVPLYILICMTGFVLHNTIENEGPKEVFTLLSSFLIAFSLNTAITKAFFSSSTYLESQSGWTNGTACVNILTHIKDVLLNNRISYTYNYDILLILYLIVGTRIIFRKDKTINLIVMIKCLTIVLMFISPFFLTIFTGSIPVQRAQLSLHFFIIIAYILLFKFTKKKMPITNIIVVILMLINLGTQSYITKKLFYTDDIRYQNDVAFSNEIVYRLGQLDISIDEMPIIFIGKKENAANGSCYKNNFILYEYYGESIFGLNSDVYPYYLGSNQVANSFLNAIGYKFKMASEEDILKARVLARDMESYPKQSSIKIVEDKFIIVKLSEDLYDVE